MKINYGGQFINNQDKIAISKSLKEEKITTGKSVDLFENKLKKKTGVKFALTCNSGTSALYLALLSIDLKKDDVVIMPSINFIASYNMCKVLNAKIFLSDVDSITGQMTPKNLEDCIKYNNLKKIKCVITMHLGGSAKHVYDFYKLKKKYSFLIIEDACHAFGSKYLFRNKKINVGSCKHVDISTFSFHPLKTITTGEGGAILTNKKLFYDKMKYLRSHGIIRSKKNWKYDIKKIGFNFRLSDLNCALGVSQLKKLSFFLKERRKNVKFYKEKLKKFKRYLAMSSSNFDFNSCHHLFIVHLNLHHMSKNKNFFLSFLSKKNIFLQQHYIPIYKFDIFGKKKFSKAFPNAEKYFRTAVSLPIFVGYNIKSKEKFINNLDIYFKKYGK